MKRKINQYFAEHKQELLEDIMAFIRIASVNGLEKPGMPFGEENAKILEMARTRAMDFGLKAEILDQKVVVVDLNDKPTQLDILAHLDVVPAGEGWTVTAPFTPIIKEGKLYGRGSSDDKGPAIAALYAVKAIKDLGYPLSKNVRLILGADEETACRDTEFYYKHNEEAPCSFSPDAEYPIINIEKGGLYTKYAASWKEDHSLPRILSFKGGTAGNVVPGRAAAFIQGMGEEELKAACQKAKKETDILYEIASAGRSNEWKILATGQSTHASTPWEGNSAVTGLLKLLTELSIADSEGFTKLCALRKIFPHREYYGQAAGVAQMDEISGMLTLGTHMIDYSLTGLMGKIDCRAPLCASKENVLDVLKAKLAGAGIALNPDSKMTPPHHVPEESPFIQMLLKCYEDVMEEPGRCMAIGGGTYAHHLKNGVAFGCMKIGTDYHMHGADEYLIVDEIVKSAELFALAISEICK